MAKGDVTVEVKGESMSFWMRWRRGAGRGSKGLFWAVVSAMILLALIKRLLAQLPTTAQLQPTCIPLGEHQTISLADGTSMEANSQTCYVQEFSAVQRLVRIESGEALFTVVHDSSRPFVVQAGRVQTRDVGTTFDVYRKEKSTHVAVFVGAVDITPRGAPLGQRPVHLTAGQQIEISDDSAEISPVSRISSADADRMTAWVHGDINFGGQAMKEIFTEFGRYRRVRFVTGDPAILGLHIGGILHTTDVDAFLSLLKTECIRSESKTDDAGYLVITLTRTRGMRPGGQCQ